MPELTDPLVAAVLLARALRALVPLVPSRDLAPVFGLSCGPG